MRVGLAFRAFFAVLGNSETAARVGRALTGETAVPAITAAKPAAEPAKTAVDRSADSPTLVSKSVAKPASDRSDALTLLATLQREARLVDFLQESLNDYSDSDIGAAVRNIHRDSAAVLRRLFDLQPVLPNAEGDTVAVDNDMHRFRLVGNVTGQPPYRGTLVHHGWVAQQCAMPEWKGSVTAAMVIAPAEVEVR